MIAMAPRAQATARDGMILIARKQMVFPSQLAMHDITARSTSLIRLSPRTTLGISQFRPSRMLGKPAHRGHATPFRIPAGCEARRRRFASAPLCSFPSSLVAEAFEFFGARFRHAAHAFAGIEPRDGALAHPVIQAIGVAVLDPQPLRRAQLIALRATCILHRLLIGDVQPLVPLRGLGLETFHHLERVAVAGLFGFALIAGMDDRHERKDGRQAD